MCHNDKRHYKIYVRKNLKMFLNRLEKKLLLKKKNKNFEKLYRTFLGNCIAKKIL